MMPMARYDAFKKRHTKGRGKAQRILEIGKLPSGVELHFMRYHTAGPDLQCSIKTVKSHFFPVVFATKQTSWDVE